MITNALKSLPEFRWNFSLESLIEIAHSIAIDNNNKNSSSGVLKRGNVHFLGEEIDISVMSLIVCVCV